VRPLVNHLASGASGGSVGAPAAIINFNGTQYPTQEQMAEIYRQFSLILG
jgi:hypothetical protein